MKENQQNSGYEDKVLMLRPSFRESKDFSITFPASKNFDLEDDPLEDLLAEAEELTPPKPRKVLQLSNRQRLSVISSQLCKARELSERLKYYLKEIE